MAETRFCDCPNCGRANVFGYQKKDKGLLGIFACDGVLIGALLGGPIGAGIGLAAAKMAADVIDEGEKYKFQCPSCDHSWIKTFKK